MLVKAGANLYAVDNRKWSPLHYAADNQRLEAAKALVEAGADVDWRPDRYVPSARYTARGRNNNPVTPYLEAVSKEKKAPPQNGAAGSSPSR